MELGYGAVDYARSRCRVNLEVQVRHFCAGRQSAQSKVGDLGGIALFHGQLADGLCIAAALLDEEFEVKRFALDDLEKVKTAGHATELHLVVQRLAGIVFMEVSLQLGAVTTIEGCEPGLERAACRSFRNCRLRPCLWLGNGLRRQCCRQR